MPITSNGFEARRFVDIVDSINQDLINRLATELNTSPDTVIGIITNIFSSAISDEEELAQAVADLFNIDKAEGKYLDDIVALTNIKRLPAGYSTGQLFLGVSQDGSIIPQGTLFEDSDGNQYETTVNNTILASSCNKAIITPNTTSGDFTVTINTSPFTVSFSSSTALSIIVDSLYQSIIASAPTDYTVTLDNEQISIELVNPLDNFSVTRNENISFVVIRDNVEAQATVVGALDPLVGDINKIVNSTTNLVSVINLLPFTVGRQEETDAELRIRHSRSTQLIGAATVPAIYSRLSNLSGVTQVAIFENRTLVTDIAGRPGKSYECVVEGGSEADISTEIWDSKPAGVQTYGDITSIIQDQEGYDQAVYWSRPEALYFNIKITYSLYSEESFPSGGESTMISTVVTLGDSLGLDKDVIPQRFYGPLYNAVSGLGEMTIEIGTSSNPEYTTPDLIGYTTDTIPVGPKQKADFDAVRVEIVQI